MTSVDAAAQQIEEVLRLHFGGNEALGLPSSVPVAPALRCTMLLTSLFFSVFLAVILLRISRVFLAGQAQSTSWEVRLSKATEALTVVPVVAILMIGTRLRAIQLAGDARLGAPPMWAQVCMYGATLACFFRFLTDVCKNDSEETLAAATGIRSTATVTLFVCNAAILLSTLIMEARIGDGEPLGAMMQCMLALAVVYFLETGAREATCSRKRKLEETSSPSYGSCAHDDDPLALPTKVSLQFPPMLCVLFVAIALRAVQLQLEPRLWASGCMYLTTLATILQQARSTVAFIQQEGKNSLLGDEAAGPAFCRDSDDKSKMFWSATTCCIYAGTVLTLLSVANMESKAEEKAPAPLSTAMGCVMALTVIYFGAYLLLMAGSLLRRFLGSWAQSTASGVQRSLAFAPMLCVMMIGVRLRAMQIGVRDPPYWSRCCMVVATTAVVTQVACSLMETDGVADKDAATKMMLILVLGLRYVASAVLFISVGSLMVSLAWMQPVL